MNCSEFDSELERLVETRSSLLCESAAAHSIECAECAQRWRDHCLIESAVMAWRPVRISANFADSVLAELTAERIPLPTPLRSESRVGMRGRWFVVGATSTLLLFIGLIVLTIPKVGDQRMAVRESRMTNLARHEGSSLEVTSSVVAVLRDLRSEYRELAVETSATAREFSVVLPPTPVSPWIDSVSPDVIPSANDNEHQLGLKTVGIDVHQGTVTVLGQSIGTQIGQAMGFLWDTVPDSVPRG